MAERPRLPGPRGAETDELARALRSGLDDGPPVDVTALSAGARAGARRLRRRRRAGVAVLAAAAVAAVPLGVGALRPGPPPAQVAAPSPEPAVSGPAAAGPGTAGGAAAGTGPVDAPGRAGGDAPPENTEPVAPEPSAPPAPSELPELSDPGAVPDAAALRAEDFDRPLVVLGDLGDYPKGPPVDGQGCGEPDPADAVPATRRAWMWAEESSNRLDQLVVDLVVTGWPAGEGPGVVTDVAADSGWCRFLDTPMPLAPDALVAPVTWAAASPAAGGGTGHAVVRLGDVVVAVSVDHPAGEAAAVTEAQRLAGVAAGRVADALT